LNTQEAFWYLTGHAPPEPYQPSVQGLLEYTAKNINMSGTGIGVLKHMFHTTFIRKVSTASDELYKQNISEYVNK
jgi:hypothetical protein